MSCPGLELLTWIALAAQAESQSEKRKRMNQRPTSWESGLVRWPLLIRCVSPVPIVGRVRHSGRVSGVEMAPAASHLGALPLPSHVVWSSLGHVPALSGKLMLARASRGSVSGHSEQPIWVSCGSGGCSAGRGTPMSDTRECLNRWASLLTFPSGWRPWSDHRHVYIHRQAPASWASPCGAGHLGWTFVVFPGRFVVHD